MTQAVGPNRIYLDLYLFQTKSDYILLNNINLLITKWVCKIYISLQLHVLEPLKMLWAGGIFYFDFVIVNNIIGLLKLHYYNQKFFPNYNNYK